MIVQASGVLAAPANTAMKSQTEPGEKVRRACR